MNLKDVRDLDIAKSQFDYLKEINQGINYSKWVEYIQQNKDYFTWEEDTENGKEILKNIDEIPEWAREGRLIGLNKRRALAEFDDKKKYFLINLVADDNKRIVISFERTPTIEDLKRFLDMAKYLDALLIKDGTEIIDEKLIESLR